MKPLIITDYEPPFMAVKLKISAKGNMQIETGEDSSDSFGLTEERAQKIIDWLTKWIEEAK